MKQLARLVVRGFYPVEEALIIDMLLHYPCVREEDLAQLLRFERIMLKERISTLKRDKFLQVKQRIETDEDGKVGKMSCYYINFKVFLNVVKYKLNLMRKKILTPEVDAGSFNCTNSSCSKMFTNVKIGELIDPMTKDLRCTLCSSPVEEEMSVGPKQDSCQVLARFNEQMDPLFDLLKKVEGLQLAPVVLEPEPVAFPGSMGEVGTGSSSRVTRGVWVNDHSRVCYTGENKVKISIGDEEEGAGLQKQKEVPIWGSQSTVVGAAREEAASSSGTHALESMTESEDHDGDCSTIKEKDEITSLLLRDLTQHEESVPESAVMLSSDDDSEIPTVKVGDEEVAVTDINEELKVRMTAGEKARYTQIFQDFYSRMYD